MKLRKSPLILAAYALGAAAWLLSLAGCQAAPAAPTALSAAPQQSTAAAAGATAGATAGANGAATGSPAAPVEVRVQMIELKGALNHPNAELSGLAWYEDNLVLLPQYPQRMAASPGGALFRLSRRQLQDYLQDPSTGPLEPQPIPLLTGGVEDQASGFEGFEALGFSGRRVFLTIEAHGLGRMHGYVVSGEIAADLSEVRLDPAGLVEHPLQGKYSNKSDEALLLSGERLLTFYEVNGAQYNPAPQAAQFDLALRLLDPLPFPNLEYRLTDAAGPDAQGRFWVINYFFSGDDDIRPQRDPLAEQYGQGPTHARYDVVERLVEFQLTPQGIQRTSTAPLQLELAAGGEARNWEGLAWAPGWGFFLATDKYPTTLLGFIAYP
ncbi:MAG: hypothetical protein ACKOC5_18440 [Chloroflexota bacterium]